MAGPDHEHWEKVDGSATVAEELVIPEVAGLQESQAAANTEAVTPLQRGDYTLQG